MKSVINSARPVPHTLNETHVNTEALIEVFWNSETFVVMTFTGKSKKPSNYVRYKSYEQMEDAIIKYVLRLQKLHAEKQAEKETAKQTASQFRAADHFAEGDILVNTYGYDQTNVSFFKVVSVKGKTISVVEINQIRVEGKKTCSMSEYVMPGDEIIGAAFNIRTKPAPNGGAYICNQFSGYMKKHDGQPCYQSWYA